MIQKIRTPKQLGAYIQETRKRQKLTQHQLAEMIGMKQKTISIIEGGSPGTRLETILLILSALDQKMEVGPNDKNSPDFSEIF